jgi:phosphoglycerate dehydrogenase-like enzyme
MKVLVTSDVFRMDGYAVRELQDAGFHVHERYDLNPRSPDGDVAAALGPDTWGIVAGGERYSSAILDECPELRVIVRAGVGTDAIDLKAAGSRSVPVVTTPGANTEGVADYCLALMLALVRQIPLHIGLVKSGAWRPRTVVGSDLHDATVGVVGLGAIGRSVVRRLSGFGCRVLAFEPTPDETFCRQFGVRVVDKASLLRESDIVSLHAPLTASTVRFLDGGALEEMKPSAYVVNTARGGLIDEAALYHAIASGRLAGAALDVVEAEPIRPPHLLLDLENVIVTGHVAGLSARSVRSMCEQAIAALQDVRHGRPPRSCVNSMDLARAALPGPTSTVRGAGQVQQ